MHCFGDDGLQRIRISGGDAHLDTVRTFEAAKQASAHRKAERVRNAGHDVVLYEVLKLVELGALRRVDSQPAAAAARERPEEIVAYGGFLFTFEMRLEALDQKLSDLPVGSIDVRARGEEQEAVDRIAFDRRKVIALRPHQHRKQYRPGHESGDPAKTA